MRRGVKGVMGDSRNSSISISSFDWKRKIARTGEFPSKLQTTLGSPCETRAPKSRLISDVSVESG